MAYAKQKAWLLRLYDLSETVVAESELKLLFADMQWTSDEIDGHLREMRQMPITERERQIFKDANIPIPDEVKNAADAAIALKNLYDRGELKAEEKKSRLHTKLKRTSQDISVASVSTASDTPTVQPFQESQSVDGGPSTS